MRATASDVGVEVVLRYRLDEHGVLVVDSSRDQRLVDESPLDVAALRAVLPLPARADEVLDLTGRWCRERSPQRRPLVDGTWLRTGRRGRTGHDATLLMVCRDSRASASAPGEVWAAHVAWSGNHEHLVERLPEGAGRARRGARRRRGARARRGAARHPVRPTPRHRSSSCTRPTRARRAHPFARAPPAGPARATAPTPAPSCSTRGRPCTSPPTSTTSGGWPTRPRRSGSSGSSSTTAGSAPAATTTAAWATGRSRQRSGPTGSARSSTTSRDSAWSSGCGSSPRWSTWTPTSCVRIPTGCSAPPRGRRCRRGASTCSTSPTPTRSRTCSAR